MLSDSDVVLAQQGDQKAFQRLAAELRRPLFQTIRWCTTEANRDDVFQDALFQIHSNLHLYRGENGASFRTWACTVALNAAKTTFRKNQKLDSLCFDSASETGEPIEMVDINDPESIIIAHETEQELEKLLGESSMRALALVLVDELSYEQAAQQLSVPIGTIRSRVSNSRARLKNSIGVSV